MHPPPRLLQTWSLLAPEKQDGGGHNTVLKAVKVKWNNNVQHRRGEIINSKVL